MIQKTVHAMGCRSCFQRAVPQMAKMGLAALKSCPDEATKRSAKSQRMYMMVLLNIKSNLRAIMCTKTGLILNYKLREMSGCRFIR